MEVLIYRMLFSPDFLYTFVPDMSLLRYPGSFGGQLTYIPRNVADLRNLVVLSDPSKPTASTHTIIPARTRAFTRVVSAPASYSAPQGRATGSVSSTNPLLKRAVLPSTAPVSQEASVQLYLSGNAIHSLPRELFSLKGLTVLSLRELQFSRNFM